MTAQTRRLLRRTARLLAVAVLAATTGCPSSTAPTAAGMAIICGGITSGIGGLPVTVTAVSSASGLRFSIQTPANDYPAVAFFAVLPGATLQALIYDDGNGSGASTLVQEAATGGTVWTQVSAQQGKVGNFALVVVDAGAAVTTDGGTIWPAPEATLFATLMPVGTLTDAGIDLVVTFPPDPYQNCPPSDAPDD